MRICAKTREALGSPVEHLTLHYQVDNLRIPGKKDFQKLQQLKNEKGELDDADEKKYRRLRKAYEWEILRNADVVCCTCVGAGDHRLANFRFKQALCSSIYNCLRTVGDVFRFSLMRPLRRPSLNV